MTMEPMPKGAPQTRVDPVTGKPFRLMHINFEPLPDDMAPAERAIIEANRSAMRSKSRMRSLRP